MYILPKENRERCVTFDYLQLPTKFRKLKIKNVFIHINIYFRYLRFEIYIYLNV